MPNLDFDLLEFERRLAASAVGSSPEFLHGDLGHVLAAGGKRLRPLLVHRFGTLLGASLEDVMELALATELLHAATLVHDDVIDRAVSRRGRPALHVRAGTEVALLVGDLYISRCGMHLAAIGRPRAAEELFCALETIVRGEMEQRHHRFDLAQDEATYLRTIQRKTASLLEAACAAAAIVAGASDNIVEAARAYGHHTGIAFQVVDDILDYTATADEIGKPAGNDIREGTVTLPLIAALAADPGVAELVEAGCQSGDFLAVVAAVRASGGLDHCDTVAGEHCALAVGALGELPEGEPRVALEELARGLQRRRS